MYRNGAGVAKDDKQACEWYQKAALQGLSNSIGLGVMYRNGRGVPKDENNLVSGTEKPHCRGLRMLNSILE